MSEVVSADELKHEFQGKLGHDAGACHFALRNEIIWISGIWTQFLSLFASEKSRVDILNATAPEFSFILEQSIADTLALGIARITDPPQQGKYENLSLGQLRQLVSIAAINDELNKAVIEAEGRANFARVHRDKRIAHSSLPHAIRKASPLPNPSRDEFQAAIDSFRRVVNVVDHHCYNGTFAWGYEIGSHDAVMLVRHLANSLEFEAWKREEQNKSNRLPIVWSDLPEV